MPDTLTFIVFCFFIVIFLFILLFAAVRACLFLTSRYGQCVKRGRCCCYFRMDWESYRRERNSLNRLRELRQRHREEVFGHPLSTFSQIPGAIPDSRNFGFILVSADYTHIPPRPIRAQLDAEQRRRILERLVMCEPYSVKKTVPEHCTVPSHDETLAHHGESQHVLPLTVDSSADRDRQQPTRSTHDDGIETSIVIPGHEEPADDSTCAICLDAFLDGELVNHSSTECKHIFHKDCLLGWLDQHDVCPCCRSTMVTEKDWKRAMDTGLAVIQEHGSRAVGQHY